MDDENFGDEQKQDEQKQDAEFQGAMELDEEVNLVALRKIRDNFSEVFRRMGGFKALNEITKEFEMTDEKTALTIVNDLYYEKKKSNKVKYRFVARLTTGRRYAKLSLQGLHRPIRHAIAKEIYHDIDICNAHPVITLELCKKLEFTHRLLAEYCANRTACINRWIGTKVKEYDFKTKITATRILRNKDDVKQYVLKLSYGGGNKNSDCAELNEMWERYQELLEKAYNHPDFKRHRERAIRNHKKEGKEWDNKKGSCMSYYLGEFENNVLTQMELFLQEKVIRYGALCFDGLMVYKSDVEDLQELLTQLETRLAEKFGFTLKLACKPMEEDVNISDLSVKEDLKTSDEDLALKLLEELKDDLVYDPITKTIWFYDDDTALWRDRKPRHIRTLISAKLTPYIETSPDPKVVDSLSSYIKCDKMQSILVRMCEPYIEKRDDALFIRENFDRQRGVFPIADKKVVNLRTGIVRPRDKTDYFTKTTQRTLVKLTEDQRKFVFDYFESLLTPEEKTSTPSEALRDNLIMTFAYILTGEMIKKIFNFIGKRDGGKSVFLDLMCSIMEGFAGWGNSRLFVAQKSKSVHDSELFNLIGKKMTCISETDEAERYNEDLLKRISGGDAVNIRGAGEKQTVDMVFWTILVIACNTPSQFKDPAFMSRLICFNFCNKFPKDPAFNDLIRTKLDHFFTVLVEYTQVFYKNNRQIVWEPEVLNYTQEICDTQDTIKVWLREDTTVRKVEQETHFIERGGFYERYCAYWKGNNRKWEGKITFFKKIEEIFGVQAVRVNGNGMCWRGLFEEGAEL